MIVLLLAETDADGAMGEVAQQAASEAHRLAARRDAVLHAVTLGGAADPAVEPLRRFGVDVVHQAHHDLLDDYAPEAWGATLAALMGDLRPAAVVAGGTERAAEVMAHAAAGLDLPLVANVTEVRSGDESAADGRAFAFTRSRWGGSLLEHATAEGPTVMLTTQPHALTIEEVDGHPEPKVELFTPALDQHLARTMVAERIMTSSGITLAEAPVVVGGGRGVGSEEGFAALEELAELLGGKVGCSRVVTNAGWRPHADQVGQTGTAIAPDIYIACGISGAIQHWAGAKGAKHVLAINTDPDANMVSRADHAVIADLHEVVPAIVAAIRSRRGG